MENNNEFRDPDYPVPSTSTSHVKPVLSEEDKVQKIRNIVEKEFANEIDCRQAELNLIEQRLWWSRVHLHKVRTEVVTQYYNSSLKNSQIQEQIAEQHEPRARAAVASILENEQKRLHPSVKKLLGKKNVDLDEIFKFREPRNAAKKNYVAMLQKKNATTVANNIRLPHLETKSEPCNDVEASSSGKEIPKPIQSTFNKVISVNEAIRVREKYRYRVVIGNTSKYAPPSSKVDRSTHKWLLYVQGPRSRPDISAIITSVHVTLHESYAPHHKVVIDNAPFFLSRRGWGEFPAKVQLHFKLPEINRPVKLTHTIKLDRNYTGLQTLGSETVFDVWLYSTDDMLHHIYKEEETKPRKVIKQEPITPSIEIKTEMSEEAENTEWLNYFTEQPELKEAEEVKQEKSEPVEENKRFMKYIDPNTGKIYYLEMDKKLDVNEVQEIVVKEKTVPSQVNISPTKNGIKYDYSHIENDHCYVLKPKNATNNMFKQLCTGVTKIPCIKIAVNYLLSKIPLISNLDEYNSIYFPFVVNNEDLYWTYDIVKRRNIEWSRAKLINQILNANFKSDSPIWRTKQILLYARLHGYYPMRRDASGDISSDNEKERQSDSCGLNVTLSKFDDDRFKKDEGWHEIDLTLDEDVDVVSVDTPKKAGQDEPIDAPQLELLMLDDVETRRLFIYIENACAKLGIVLSNQDIGCGYSYSIVHALIHCAMKKFAEELIRSALAYKLTKKRKKEMEINSLPYLPLWESCEGISLDVSDISRGARWRLSTITNQYIGVTKITNRTPL